MFGAKIVYQQDESKNQSLEPKWRTQDTNQDQCSEPGWRIQHTNRSLEPSSRAARSENNSFFLDFFFKNLSIDLKNVFKFIEI